MRYKSNNNGEKVNKKDYSKKVIFSLSDFEEKGHLLQEVIIPPHTKQRLHFHNTQTEVYYVLEGECSIFVNGEEFVASPGDGFIVSPKDKHQLWNKSDKPFILVVFKINMPESTDDTEWLEE